MNTYDRFWRSAFTGLVLSTASSCASTAIETAAPVASTDHGVATVVSASLEDTAERTTRAFQDLGIQLTGVESDPDAREYSGTHDEMSVRAALMHEAPDRTRIEVSARNGGAVLDQGYARKVLQRILRQR